ncbi:MAG: 4-hydroxy-tetrahydrodipicolinate synthase [Deltaproteobacteria bacterium]|nr:4-hydroxy-tetrahydrodipicolinate synthase [Deltaproteobacteria bacterium]
MASPSTPSPFHGLGTALITPFQADGELDLPSLDRLVEQQLSRGVNFLVPLGSTGESATLSEAEQLRLLDRVREKTAGRLPLLAGCGGNNTRAVIQRGKAFQKEGITHILSVTPYYNRPTQQGIFQHFQAIRQETGLNLMAYTVPVRTGINLEPDTVCRLAEEGIAFAVKEASGNPAQIQKILAQAPAGFQVFSGDDSLTLPIMAMGGVGVISVASNVIPGPMSRWVGHMAQGDYQAARAMLPQLIRLFDALFVESNPIPVKGAAQLLGLAQHHLRLPLTSPGAATLDRLKKALEPFQNGE